MSNERRIIATREELDALPDRSLIETKGQIVFQKYADWFSEGVDGWQRPGHEWTERVSTFDEPAHHPIRVVWEPQS